MACWVDGAPTQRLLDFYQAKVREMRSKHLDLTRIVNEAKDAVVKYADDEMNALKTLKSTNQLQESLSELQRYLYKERSTVLRLTSEIDQMKIEKADDRRKIEFLLKHCGLKESQLYLNPLDRLSSPLKRRQKPKVRFNDFKNLEIKLSNFKNSEYDILNLRVKALEAELKEQTELLQDEIFNLEQDIEIRKKEWLAEKTILERKVACLNCRLQNVQFKKLDEISEMLKTLDEERTREIKLIDENEKLRRSVTLCKEILGDRFPGENSRKQKDETRNMKDQLMQKERLIRDYQGQISEFESRLTEVRKLYEAERENAAKLKERFTSKEEFLMKKFEDERTRRLLEGEGFRNDIKQLRIKLQSIERKFRHERIKKGLQND